MSDISHSAQSEAGDLFDAIRAGYRFVAGSARHVRILDDRLKEYAFSLPLQAPGNALDSDHHYMTDDPEALAAATLILDAVNFGSGYTDALVHEGWDLLDQSIYFTVSTALKNHFDAHGVFTAGQLCDLTTADLMAVLHLPAASPAAQAVAALFTPSVNELGSFIENDYAGRFIGLIEASEGRAANFISRLGTLPGFHDVHSYQGREIPIFKRAQHASASLHGFFARIGQTLFRDIDRLTIFPDNAIPHVLRVDGLLAYAPELAAKIDAGIFIPSGSEEEIEMRCCAGEAMERIAAIKGVKAIDLDYALWHRSVEDARYAQGLPHRTATRFY